MDDVVVMPSGVDAVTVRLDKDMVECILALIDVSEERHSYPFVVDNLGNISAIGHLYLMLKSAGIRDFRIEWAVNHINDVRKANNYTY